MKILFLTDTLQAGGRERQLVELLKGLKKRNDIKFQLVVLSDLVHFSYVKGLNIKIHFVPRKFKNDPIVFIKVFKICAKFKPDIVHTWESMCSVYVLPSVKILGIKFIDGTIRNAPSHLKVPGKYRARSKLTFLCSDAILANSYAGLKSYNAPLQKSNCIHNGFDFSRIKNLRDPELIREKYKINTPYIVGMVAVFHVRKDYETFILAALHVVQKRNDVTFLAIGDGSTLDKCKKMVPQECCDRIKFPGKQKNIESLVNVFDVGVLAANKEGLSNSIMEYMALGKPVVATNSGGMGEIVIHNKTGFLVKPGDPGELAEKIEFLLDHKEIARAMGSAGKERLFSEFSLDKMTERHVKLYQKFAKSVAQELLQPVY